MRAFGVQTTTKLSRYCTMMSPRYANSPDKHISDKNARQNIQNTRHDTSKGAVLISIGKVLERTSSTILLHINTAQVRIYTRSCFVAIDTEWCRLPSTAFPRTTKTSPSEGPYNCIYQKLQAAKKPTSELPSSRTSSTCMSSPCPLVAPTVAGSHPSKSSLTNTSWPVSSDKAMATAEQLFAVGSTTI